jgi:hypothetical protein
LTEDAVNGVRKELMAAMSITMPLLISLVFCSVSDGFISSDAMVCHAIVTENYILTVAFRRSFSGVEGDERR